MLEKARVEAIGSFIILPPKGRPKEEVLAALSTAEASKHTAPLRVLWLDVQTQPSRLPLWTKLLYGSGDWSLASLSTLRQIFYAIFLTDVVGLDPRLGSFGALIGLAWDAVNDPLVGLLSDRLHTRWGRRRPFLFLFAMPLALSFVLLWYAPPWESQIALLAYVTAAFMLTDTFSTLIGVPYLSLTPELAPDYDERTTLTGYRMFFHLAALLATVVAAPLVVDAVMASGASIQQGYLVVAALFGGLAALPFLTMPFFIRERAALGRTAPAPIGAMLRAAWANVPFRFAVGIHMFNWTAVDLIALTLPYFLLYWAAQGDVLATIGVLGAHLALESVVLGSLIAVSILALPFWTWLARRLSKREAYVIGMSFWVVIQLLLWIVPSGGVNLLLGLALLAGLSVSTAHVLPDSIFPDIIEWDELRTRRRQEGIYYGARTFIRKITSMVTVFAALQVLGWAGYQAPPEGVTVFQQSEHALTAIRLLVGPCGALLLFGAVIVAWQYPLTREQHTKIRRLLAQRNAMRPASGEKH